MDWIEVVGKIAVIFAVFLSILLVVPLLVYGERKIAAFIQDRVGPDRVGLAGPDGILDVLVGKRLTKRRVLGGLLQPFADALKLLVKEDIVPEEAEPAAYTLAPLFALLPPLLAFAVIPMAAPIRVGGSLFPIQISDLNVGIVWVLAVTSLSAYGIVLGGWGSGSKYPLLGAIRASAQVISYAVGMGLALLAVLMQAGTLRMSAIVSQQSEGIGHWFLWSQPLAFLIFLVCAFAENNRLPFDLAECESELVAGYHTEYSSMKFIMFLMGEYVAMMAASAAIVTLFLGGWSFPGIVNDGSVPMFALSFVVFWAKTFSLLFLYMWVRWTLPRLRFDQLMRLGWSFLVPLGLLNLALTAVVLLG